MANYIDNVKFLEEMTKFRLKCFDVLGLPHDTPSDKFMKACKKAEKTGVKLPIPSNFIGKCINDISYHLATKPNFSNYPFKDEMISDGIENCITYIKNFDPNKSKNPFAYFSQITYFAFLRRIQNEKKLLYKKGKYAEREFLEQRNYSGVDGLASNEFGSVVDIENPMDTEYMHALIGYKDEMDASKKALKEEELKNKDNPPLVKTNKFKAFKKK